MAYGYHFMERPSPPARLNLVAIAILPCVAFIRVLLYWTDSKNMKIQRGKKDDKQ
ncbi:hypothetical protein GCM10008922_30000 [Faecalicatena contorta]